MNIYIILIIISIITAILFANYLYNYLLILPTPIKDSNPFGYCNINLPYIKPFGLADILTEQQCNEMINYCYDKKTDNGNTTGIYVNETDNAVCWIPKTDYRVKNVIEKLATMFKIPFENAENARITRYFPNQSFNNRFDACCDDTLKCRDFLKKGGQRLVSVLIYLTDDYTGGETFFQNIGLKFKPKKGDGIVSYLLDLKTNKCHPALSYSGLPIDTGVKWIVNIWFRESKII